MSKSMKSKHQLRSRKESQVISKVSNADDEYSYTFDDPSERMSMSHSVQKSKSISGSNPLNQMQLRPYNINQTADKPKYNKTPIKEDGHSSEYTESKTTIQNDISGSSATVGG